ncbi:2-isopropylmalate synthase [Pararhodospirillum photometricum]|nr:2-isopropylmalate synthase [Pararhodospirillum photometricum]
MLKTPAVKYPPFLPPTYPDRTWPDRRLERAPRWCSTDLRDGNQALVEPMDLARKNRLYDLLVRLGFKEIEVAFPAASAVEQAFVRSLIDDNRIPADVTLQVMTPARPPLIATTIAALAGAPRAIVHLYNATAPLFRRVVFGLDQTQTVALAVEGTRLIRELTEARPETRWTYQYSPETFCFTEWEFALEICERVRETWGPTAERPLILNLPTTVEVAMPNAFADQIEWFHRHLSSREHVTLSVHPHNDRGTAVATAEQALLAGAERIEGCLFGNGERTGNVDLLTLALNLYTQGIDPGLDFSALDEVKEVLEWCTGLPVPARHPYAGALVYTAFSGSHQDAIRKGFAAREARGEARWEIPYLPLDPADVGRSYEAVIRVNSQSGKGGAAWVVERALGVSLPKGLQADFGRRVQALADAQGGELDAEAVCALFARAYFVEDSPALRLIDHHLSRDGETCVFRGTVSRGQEPPYAVEGRGNGSLSSALAALASVGVCLSVRAFSEQSLERGAEARAIAFLEAEAAGGRSVFGVGLDTDTTLAALRAVVSAANAVLGDA